MVRAILFFIKKCLLWVQQTESLHFLHHVPNNACAELKYTKNIKEFQNTKCLK